MQRCSGWHGQVQAACTVRKPDSCPASPCFAAGLGGIDQAPLRRIRLVVEKEVRVRFPRVVVCGQAGGQAGKQVLRPQPS